MVPCLGCGRDFCRLCDPPRGAGQYCRRCYEETLRDLERSGTKGGRLRGRSGRRVEDRKDASAPGSRRAGAAAALRGALEVVAAVPGKAGRATRASVPAARSFARERCPVVLKEKERATGPLPLGGRWPALAAVALGGAVVLAAVSAVTRHRHPCFYVVAACLVALGVALSMGARFDPWVAAVAVVLAVFALVAGELLVQVLYRLSVIRKLDVDTRHVGSSSFYAGYFRSLVLFKLLPAAAAAFVVAWWPFPRRPGWRGFHAPRRTERP